MFRLAGIALLAVSAFAQQSAMPPEPPPPGMDQALRARIQEFYGYFISGQYRKAEKLVAEDSQDWYYDHDKPRYQKCDIKEIEYSDQFTRARVVMMCDQTVIVPGYSGVLQMAARSRWKSVDGQWFWYIDQDELRRTPFGVLPKPGPGPAPVPTGSLPAAFSSVPSLAMVKLENDSVAILPGASAEVSIANIARGPVTLSIDSKPVGVEARLDHELLSAGQKAVLSVHAAAGARPGRIVLRVHETGALIPIEVKIN